MRFFERAIQPRFPRDPAEGAIKALLIAGFLLSSYDIATSSDLQTHKEKVAHSGFIVQGYLLFLFLGIICGAIGKQLFQAEGNVQAPRPR